MSKRLKDVLDNFDTKGLGKIYDKFVTLHRTIESTNPDMDNVELRWVENKIEKMEDGYEPTKKDLKTANTIWKKWNTNNRSSK